MKNFNLFAICLLLAIAISSIFPEKKKEGEKIVNPGGSTINTNTHNTSTSTGSSFGSTDSGGIDVLFEELPPPEIEPERSSAQPIIKEPVVPQKQTVKVPVKQPTVQYNYSSNCANGVCYPNNSNSSSRRLFRRR